jgi:hypothetical protein
VGVYRVEIDRGNDLNLDVRERYESEVRFVRGEIYMVDGDRIVVEWVMPGNPPVVRVRPIT